MTRPRFLPDNFTLALIATVIIASLIPCHGQGAVAFGYITNFAVGLLFFFCMAPSYRAKRSLPGPRTGGCIWWLCSALL